MVEGSIVEGSIVVDSALSEAYVRNISLVPYGTPPHRPMWSAAERRSRASFRQHPQTDRFDRADCQHARSLRRIHFPRSSPTTARSEPHSVPPAHRHHERPRTTNRRSTWAGVSWPDEDADNAGELDELRRTSAPIQRRRLTAELMSRSSLWCACWRGRLHARSSSPNYAVRRPRSIEVKS